jgi:hypothetical protein
LNKIKVPIYQPRVEESLIAELMSGKGLPEAMAPLIKCIVEAMLEVEAET